MVPLVLPALLVFSHLAPDAGRSTALVLVACLPLPHSPAALCLRPIIPLPDLIFFCSPRRPRGLKGEILLQIQTSQVKEEKSIHNGSGEAAVCATTVVGTLSATVLTRSRDGGEGFCATHASVHFKMILRFKKAHRRHCDLLFS